MTRGSGHDGDANLRGLKVLIVEDEAVVAFDLEYILRDLGCAPVPSVGSVADAFDAIATERPDVVLLDVRLTDGSSAPFATHLEAQGIAYLVVTGYDQAQLEPALRNAPRVAKPYQPSELKAALAAAASARGG